MVDQRREGLPPKTEWRTPLEVFHWIEKIYSIKFDLDPATSEDNPLGTRFFFTPRTDGLAHSWRGRRVFVNPPYGREISRWIEKAVKEVLDNPDDKDLEIVMLLPSATDTKWFKRLWDYADIIFLTGRIQFVGAHGSGRGGYVLAYMSPLIPNDNPCPMVLDLLG